MSYETEQIDALLKVYDAAKPETFDELIRFSVHRLEALAHRHLNGEVFIRRWEETGDVLQNATVRLYRALQEVRPANKKEFFLLAATMIRREIIDMARKYRSEYSDAAHHHTAAAAETGNSFRYWEGKIDASPEQLLMFHEAVEQLEPDDRALFELRFYQGMDLNQAAETLGISERTARRRWRSARLTMERYYQVE